jgi:phosphoribosylanthranilate isomerase
VTKVKICGITQPEHGLAALEAGADLLGFVFYPPSHRYLTPEQARQIVAECRQRFPSGWAAVGVFVNLEPEQVNSIAQTCSFDLVQLAGEESPGYCAAVSLPVVKVIRFGAEGGPSGPIDAAAWNAHRILIDSDRPGRYGGTGEPYDWAGVRPFAKQALLAGGLTPDNAADAVRTAQPWGLDVSSGVERNGVKQPELIREFLAAVKGHGAAR